LANTSNLHVHHIDHNKQNNVRENLVALCQQCHGRHHPHLNATCDRENEENINSNSLVIFDKYESAAKFAIEIARKNGAPCDIARIDSQWAVDALRPV
jgi:hypothetical protein